MSSGRVLTFIVEAVVKKDVTLAGFLPFISFYVDCGGPSS